MKILNSNRSLVQSFLICTIILFVTGCSVDSPQSEQVNPSNNKQVCEGTSSFHDETFTGHTDFLFREMAIDENIENLISLISFYSDYYDGDTIVEPSGGVDYETFVLFMYNRFLENQHLDTLTSFPMDFIYPMNDHTDISFAVRNYVRNVLDQIDDSEWIDEGRIQYNEIAEELDLTSTILLTSSQKDTVATILYSVDILLNWWLNDEMFNYPISEFNDPNNQHIEVRWGGVHGHPHGSATWGQVKCAVSVGLFGVAGWAGGGLLGAAAGAWGGFLEGDCDSL